MKTSNILSYATFFLALVFSTTIFAADATSGKQDPRKTSTTVTPATLNTIGKLPSLIKINPADIAMITTLINASIDDNMEKSKAAGKDISSASADMVKLLSNIEQDISNYRNKVNECKNKNYTTQDQKDAHCTDDMTVAQCSQCLFKMCKTKEHSAILQDTNNMIGLINYRLKNSTGDLEKSVRYINKGYDW